MKVKVGNKIYDGEDAPVMVILSDADKRNIANMLPECTKYASFPYGSNDDDMEKWMDAKEDYPQSQNYIFV